MRVVLDTNVLIAAFVTRGQCNELLEHTARAHTLYASEFILSEFREKLLGKFKVPCPAVEATLSLQRSRMIVLEPAALPEPVCRDPDDDQVLALALAAGAECLISGDKDLLTMENFRGTTILAPAGFWQFEAGKRT